MQAFDSRIGGYLYNMTTGHSQGCSVIANAQLDRGVLTSLGEEFFNQRELTETHQPSCASSTVRNSLAILSSTPLTYLWDSVAPNFLASATASLMTTL